MGVFISPFLFFQVTLTHAKKGLTPKTQVFFIRFIAEVVKLVYAVDSKSSEQLLVPVRFRPSAPYLLGGYFYINCRIFCFNFYLK